MQAPEVLVLQASYSNAVHAEAIGFLLNTLKMQWAAANRCRWTPASNWQ